MDIVKGLQEQANKEKSVAIPATQFLRQENGLCSVFNITVEPGRKAYRYDVDIINVAKKKSLTKGADDGQRALNRTMCYDLLTVAYTKTGGFGMAQGGEVVYDNRSTLYTSVPINLPKVSIEVHPSEVSDLVRRATNNASFTVSILRNLSGHALDLCNLEQYTSKRSIYEEDRSLRTFLEMAISQFAINMDTHTQIGTGKMFERGPENEQQVDNGIVLRSGVAKGVRVINDKGKLSPALVLDAKVCPFYKSQCLLDTIRDMSQSRFNGGGRNRNQQQRSPQQQFPHASDTATWEGYKRQLIDVRVEVIYAPNRSFAIGSFTTKPLSEYMVDYMGTKVTTPEFFRLKHKVELKYPNLPGVVPNTPPPGGKGIEMFPIEQLFVMDDQRVPLERMNKGLSDKLLNANSIPPQERHDKIMKHADALHIFDTTNAVLRGFGITIERNSNRTMIGVRSCPRIRFAGKTLTPNPQTAEWRRDAGRQKFVQGGEVKNWIVLFEQRDSQIVKDFIRMYMEAAVKKGMRFGNPIPVQFTLGWVETFKRCVDGNIEFVMLIDRKAEDSHGKLKYYEALYKVLTQHVTLERIEDVVKSRKLMTLDNIINKTNQKNFGLNYQPIVESLATAYDLDRDEVLVIGYDVAHPPAVSTNERRMMRARGITADSLDPSVVGICANVASNPHNFVGRYFYQESRREAVDMGQLTEQTHSLLTLRRKNRPNTKNPKFIVILRDGLSEGQFAMAVEDEMAAIRQGCSAFDPNFNPKFMFVIGTKRHFKKFFLLQNGQIKNLAPCSVICEGQVRADCPEFFMQAHYPLKGVGKPVQYAVPVDEIGMSQDELQAFLNALCYSHQIVNMAVSLPEPVYQADELAKRGRNNYLTMKTIDHNGIPRLPSQMVDGRALTRLLSYDEHRLASTRFTA